MNEEKKKYEVYITQHYKPISVMANSSEEAEDLVQNHYTWGEPSSVEVLAVGIYESKPTEINPKNKNWSKKL